MVLVTHYMDEAEALCDRLAVFSAGRIIATGAPAEIVAAHAQTATITFTGTADGLAGVAGVHP